MAAGHTHETSSRWPPATLALLAVAVVVAGLLMLSAPRPRAHVFRHGRELLASHRALPRPPAEFTAHAGAIAGRLHTAGLFVLIAGLLVALLAAWLWRSRPGSGPAPIAA